MKVNWLTLLQVIKADGDRWKLAEPFSAYLDTDELARANVPGAIGYMITVPAGFEMDFASVPRIPLAYWLVGNTAHRSAVLHDYLYAVKAPRELADDIFNSAMEAEGVPAWRRAMMYRAVRMFGGGYYDERSDEPAEAPVPPA
jgi:hypothetical protein